MFTWVDANENGTVQPDEVQMRRASVSGITVLEDLSFCIARINFYLQKLS